MRFALVGRTVTALSAVALMAGLAPAPAQAEGGHLRMLDAGWTMQSASSLPDGTPLAQWTKDGVTVGVSAPAGSTVDVDQVTAAPGTGQLGVGVQSPGEKTDAGTAPTAVEQLVALGVPADEAAARFGAWDAALAVPTLKTLPPTSNRRP